MLKTSRLFQQVLVCISASLLLFALCIDSSSIETQFLSLWFVLLMCMYLLETAKIDIKDLQEQIDKLNYRLFKETQRRN